MTDLQKIGALFVVLVALVVAFAVTEENLVGTVTALYAIAAGVVLGRILVRHEPPPADAGTGEDRAGDESPDAAAGTAPDSPAST